MPAASIFAGLRLAAAVAATLAVTAISTGVIVVVESESAQVMASANLPANERK